MPVRSARVGMAIKRAYFKDFLFSLNFIAHCGLSLYYDVRIIPLRKCSELKDQFRGHERSRNDPMTCSAQYANNTAL